jgi:hypothetical protein
MASKLKPGKAAPYSGQYEIVGPRGGRTGVAIPGAQRTGLHDRAVAQPEAIGEMSVVSLHRWPPANSGGTNAFSPSPYRPGKWHHVVGTRQGSTMSLFVDGW